MVMVKYVVNLKVFEYICIMKFLLIVGFWLKVKSWILCVIGMFLFVYDYEVIFFWFDLE